MSLPVIGWNQSSVYGVDPYSSDLHSIDTTTLISTTITLTSNTGTVDGCNGLATDPCGGTTYVIYQSSGTRYLGTVNLTTGVITETGSLSDNVSTIAYDYNTSILYGVTGDGANTPETLYEINTTTAAMTLIIALGNGDDGEALTFNPTDNLLYHWSGWGLGDVVMETIDPSTFVISPITLSGDDILNVGSAVYTGGGFLVSDINDGTLHWVTSTGTVTNTTSNLALKGLAFSAIPSPTLSLLGTPGTVICPSDSVMIQTIATGAGLTYEWFDGSNVSTGITNPTITSDTAGTFTCEITDLCGVTVSSSITLTTGTNPVFQLTPSGTNSICPGDSLLVSANITGTDQWFFNGTSIAGETNDSIYLFNEGVYNMIHTNADGCSDSASVGITITFNSVPNVTLTPSGNAEYCPGDSVELQVNTGGGAIQWYLNGTAIPNANANSYYASSIGSYNVIKTNLSGCQDSSSVPISVSEAMVPSVILTPFPQVIFCGPNTVDISVNNGGGTRQWYKNGVAISGEIGMSYTVSSPGIYNVLKTNMSGCSDSAAIGTAAIDTCLLNINEFSLNLSFEMYPNPVSEKVYLEFPSDWIGKIESISIFSLDGKLVVYLPKESLLKDIIDIQTEGIQSGIYVVEVQTQYQKVHKELMIE